jgi:hypothetical protein
MNAILSKLIDQLNSSVFILLAVLICTLWAIYKIGKWTERFRNHEEKITKVEGLADKVLVMTTKVDLIYEHTLGPRRPVAAQSPISLTNIGREIAEKIKANTILEKCLPQLTSEVDAITPGNPGNAYDIQLAAMKVAKEKMLSCLNESELIAVKQEAYDRGLLVEDILAIFGVLLRDRILNNKGLSILDVDKHTPIQK